MNTRQSLDIERQRLLERFEEQPEGRVFAPLADCHRKLGDLDEALRICMAGMVRHPEYSSAYVILGKIQLERADESAARTAFERVLELDSHNLLALRQLAEIEERSGDLASAEARWQQVAAMEIEPETAEARIEAIRERRVQATAFAEPAGEAADVAAEAVPPTEQDRVEAESAILEPVQEPVEEPVSEPVGVSQAEEVQVESSDHEASTIPADEVEPAAPEPARPAKRAAVPTAEIATMTLAEIYSEQGFKGKALEIYRQILERNPDVSSLAERIHALEAEMARPAPVETPPEAAVAEEQAQEADLDELETSIVPTPVSQLTTAGGSGSEFEDEVEEPRAKPSPPLESPQRSAKDPLGENERFTHFRSWLDRIRVDEN